MSTANNTIKNVIDLSEFNCYSFTDIKEIKSFENKSTKSERTRKLCEYFKKNTPKHVQNELFALCAEYTDIFALPEDPMTVNNFYKQKLRSKNDTPVYAKNYRLPKIQRAEIDTQVSKLLKNNLIEPSTSSFNSPLISIPKKSLNGEKKWRMCVDYRMLNKNLFPDKFPLPRIDDILDSLGRAKYFSCLDLFSGFHQIPLEPESREMTAFSTDKGAFRSPERCR